eukprot:878640-Pelagomonas_calceolata.AAC.1
MKTSKRAALLHRPYGLKVHMDDSPEVDGGSMTAVFEMLHLIIGSPTWDEASLERAKTAFLSSIK